MKRNLNLLTFIFIVSAGMLFISCADESSDASQAEESTTTSMKTDAQSSTSMNNQSAGNANAMGNQSQSNQQNNPNMPTTSMKFEKSTHDFGTVTSGEKVTHKYQFTNTGDEPLIISNVKASCGCTAPSYSREPVAPGETGFIDVQYSASGKGKTKKNVTITANTKPAKNMIYLTANVVKKNK